MAKKVEPSAAPKLVYSTDRVAIVRAARGQGMTDEQILLSLVANEYGSAARRKILKEWAPALSLTEQEALALARRAGILK